MIRQAIAMTYGEARKLKPGDRVWVHTSVVLFTHQKRWVKATVVGVKDDREREGVPEVVIRCRGSRRRWSCDGSELRRAKPKS